LADNLAHLMNSENCAMKIYTNIHCEWEQW